MDGGAWWATVHGVKELDMTERLHVTSLENSEESEIKLPTSAGSEKKQENSRKTPSCASLIITLTVWITIDCGKF